MSLYLGNTEIRGLATGDAALALPELDNPATADKILSGYEVIDADGKILTGTIATKTSSNLTASGATVTAPAGYYASAASKSVATATQATPSISVDSAGLITASATQTAGYVSAGTKSATKQLTTQAAKTVTPSTSEQTAVASGVYTTGAVKVAAMPTATQATPSISVDSAGLITASATQTAGYVAAGTKSGTKQLTVQAAKTITPGTSNQTAVASGVYTTGAVTVAGDADLIPANIVSGKNIFGVAGTAISASDISWSSQTIISNHVYNKISSSASTTVTLTVGKKYLLFGANSASGTTYPSHLGESLYHINGDGTVTTVWTSGSYPGRYNFDTPSGAFTYYAEGTYTNHDVHIVAIELP